MNTNDTAIPLERQMESIKVDNLLINFTTDFQRLWDNRRNSESKPVSFWRPTPSPDLLPGYFPLGDCVDPGVDNINGKRIVAVVREASVPSDDPMKGKALSAPIDFDLIWKNTGDTTSSECSIWRPRAPSGYWAVGHVCSNGHDKPSLNSVRCVRMDLLVDAKVGAMIWNDKYSGARQNFGALSVQPPVAAQGEIFLSMGTFVGNRSHAVPDFPLAVVSLRMQIPHHANPFPVAPALKGYQMPEVDETTTVTQSIQLPWFAVVDPGLSRLEQLRTSPWYRLERTDRYTFIGHAHNTGEEIRTCRWTAPRVQRAEKLKAFSEATTIEMQTPWPRTDRNMQKPEFIQYSARLDEGFAHSDNLPGGWNAVPFVEVIANVGKNKAVALYQLQSDYRLWRENGTQVVSDLSYTHGDSLHLSEYPPAKECATIVPAQPVTELPTATDTAP
jgi:hypothetical protein